MCRDYRTELYRNAMIWLHRGGQIPPTLEHALRLKSELRKFMLEPNSGGAGLKLQPKKKTHGNNSPDVADAFSYSFAANAWMTTTRKNTKKKSVFSHNFAALTHDNFSF